MKYNVTDEDNSKVYLKTDDLKEAIKLANSLYFQSLREGWIFYYNVWNNSIGTLAFVAGKK